MPSRSPAARLDGDFVNHHHISVYAHARALPLFPHARWCCHHQSTTSMEYVVLSTPWFSGVGPPSATCCSAPATRPTLSHAARNVSADFRSDAIASSAFPSSSSPSLPRFFPRTANDVKCASMSAEVQLTAAANDGVPGGGVASATAHSAYVSSQRARYDASCAAADAERPGRVSAAMEGSAGRATSA